MPGVLLTPLDAILATQPGYHSLSAVPREAHHPCVLPCVQVPLPAISNKCHRKGGLTVLGREFCREGLLPGAGGDGNNHRSRQRNFIYRVRLSQSA